MAIGIITGTIITGTGIGGIIAIGTATIGIAIIGTDTTGITATGKPLVSSAGTLYCVNHCAASRLN
jgi:hypothetical protein